MPLDKVQRDRVNRYLACVREADKLPGLGILPGGDLSAPYRRLMVEAGGLYDLMNGDEYNTIIVERGRDFRS